MWRVSGRRPTTNCPNVRTSTKPTDVQPSGERRRVRRAQHHPGSVRPRSLGELVDQPAPALLPHVLPFRQRRAAGSLERRIGAVETGIDALLGNASGREQHVVLPEVRPQVQAGVTQVGCERADVVDQRHRPRGEQHDAHDPRQPGAAAAAAAGDLEQEGGQRRRRSPGSGTRGGAPGAKSCDVAVSTASEAIGCTSQTATTTAARRSRTTSTASPASAAAASAIPASATEEPDQASPSRRQNSLDPGSITGRPAPTPYFVLKLGVDVPQRCQRHRRHRQRGRRW